MVKRQITYSINDKNVLTVYVNGLSACEISNVTTKEQAIEIINDLETEILVG